MASVDTQYSATLPASVPDQSAAGGTGAQVARTGNDKAEDIDWFSPAQAYGVRRAYARMGSGLRYCIMQLRKK